MYVGLKQCNFGDKFVKKSRLADRFRYISRMKNLHNSLLVDRLQVIVLPRIYFRRLQNTV